MGNNQKGLGRQKKNTLKYLEVCKVSETDINAHKKSLTF